MPQTKAFALIFLLFFLQNTEIFAAKYYWVGGSGKWSELNHWSPFSGNTDVHHAQIPGAADTVFFDANSFSAPNQIVEIDVGDAFCSRMDWSGASYTPTLDGSGNLTIYGELTLTPAMNFDFAGNVYFYANGRQNTIYTAAHHLAGAVFFGGDAGNWNINTFSAADIVFGSNAGTYRLLGDLSASGEISITAGNFISNNFTIQCSKFSSLSYPEKNLELGNSTFFLAKAWFIGGQNQVLQAENTHLIFTGNQAGMAGGSHQTYNIVEFRGNESHSGLECTDCSFAKVLFENKATLSGNNNSFDTLQIQGDGTINGSHSYNHLLLGAGSEYVLQSGTTQQIVSELQLSGTCSQYSILQASNPENRAIVSKQNGLVSGEFLIFKGIETQGAAVFLAENSVDLLNNQGWIINENPRNLFWVGNSGQWSDPAHWALTSGGAGGACVPSPLDNVFFDQNSFSHTNAQVDINVKRAFCKNMNWTGVQHNPAFISSYDKSNLFIYGSLTFVPQMQCFYQGQYLFEAPESGNTIQSGGHIFPNHIFFRGQGGWGLLDTLQTLQTINFYSGTLHTNNQPVLCDTFRADVPNERQLFLGSSEISVGKIWKATASNLEFDAGTSRIEFLAHNAQMQAGNRLKYNLVHFSSPTGKPQLQGNAEFRKVIFDSNAKIQGNNQMNVLYLTPSKEYLLQQGDTLSILDTLRAQANCEAHIIFRSATENQAAFLQKNSGTIQVEYVILHDVHAIGNASFVAQNSVDLGNTGGWQVFPPQGKNLFWVGGTGRWNDPQHWAYQSGGTPGACIPFPVDNVFFDQNSFPNDKQNDTVKVEIDHIFCHDITWQNFENQPVFASKGSPVLNVFGSVQLSPEMQLNFEGDWVFEATQAGQNILSAGKSFPGNLVFKGEGGEWTFSDSLHCRQGIRHQRGVLRTGGNTVRTRSYNSNSPDFCRFVPENSLIEIEKDWKTGQNFELAQGDFFIRFTEMQAEMQNNADNELLFNDVEFLQGQSAISGQSNVWFHNVEFKSNGTIKPQSGSGQFRIFNLLVFNNFATIQGNNSADSVRLKGGGKLVGTNTANWLLSQNFTTFDGQNQIAYADVFQRAVLKNSNNFGTALFRDDATFYGNNSFDSLFFFPDKQYVLEAGHTQTIGSFLKISGNQCFKISLKSNAKGSRAFLKKQSGTISGNFIEMQNIEAIGGATFYAGNASHNIENSNIGWVFDNDPAYIYGFPPDSIFISSNEIVLTSENFNGDQNTQYFWNTGSTANSIAVSQPGKYWLTAVYSTEGGECSFRDTITIFFAEIQKITCHNGSDGSIGIQAPPAGSYAYLWNQSDTTQSIDNLTAGNYILQISDLNTGNQIQGNFSLENPPKLDFDLQIQPISCTGYADGRIEIHPQPDFAPYSYFFEAETPTSDSVFNNLQPDIWYHFQIQDRKGCTTTDSVQLSEPAPLQIEIAGTNPGCFGLSNGSALACVQGGTPPYSFVWSGTSATDSLAQGLQAGLWYQVQATDAHNCPAVTDSILLSDPPELELQFSDISPVSCFGQADGSVVATASGGTPPYSYIWESPQSTDSLAFELAGETFYYVTVSDAGDCQSRRDSIKLDEPPEIRITLADKSPVACSGDSNGVAALSVSGGVRPFGFRWDTGQWEADSVKENLTGGFHQIALRDANGCEKDFDFSIGEPAPLQLDVSGSVADCATNTGFLSINGFSENGELIFRVSDENDTEIQTLSGLSPGKYYVLAQDPKGCSIADSARILPSDCRSEIEVPNVFSPNHDGLNEIFRVKAKNIKEFHGVIFNRWGREIFQWNDAQGGWNGKLNGTGKVISEGTYFYIIQAIGEDLQRFDLNGSFHLLL